MIVRKSQSGTVIFQESNNKATYASPEHIAEVLDFDFDSFPACWELNTNGFFDIHPVEGWYSPLAITTEQQDALAELVAAFDEIKAVEGVTGDEW